MKRVVIIIFVLLTVLCSCRRENAIPVFDSYPMTLSGTLTCNGNSYDITAVVQGEKSVDISIESPKRLSGYSFKVDNSSVWVYYDSMEIGLKTGVTDIPFSLIPEMLSVSRTDFRSLRTQGEKRICYYTKNGAEVVVYIKNNEDIPCRIEYNSGQGNIAFDIEEFTVQ